MTEPRPYTVIVRTSAAYYGTVRAASKAEATRLAQLSFDDGRLEQCAEETEAITAFKRRRRTGTWSQFERKFRPKDSTDGTVWWSREQLPKDVDPRLVWTIVDTDGKLYVLPGFRLVNRIDYVLCDAAWTDEDLYQPGYRYD